MAGYRVDIEHGHAAGRGSEGDVAPGGATAIVAAFFHSAARTAWLLARHRLRLPRARVGLVLAFGDGTTSRVYRETVSLVPPPVGPCLLVVTFQLRGIGRSRPLHAMFRAESLLNTPLFAGFPGFRSKLWLTDPETGLYHGVYEWDGVREAESYATTLLVLLKLVSRPGSVRFHVRPGITPGEVLADPGVLGGWEGAADRWWRFRREEHGG